MEGDLHRIDRKTPKKYFNPLPPHGGRQTAAQSKAVPLDISIHSLRMEGDPESEVIFQTFKLFQSTPSAWRETLFPSDFLPFREISIHSLRMEGDAAHSVCFLPTPTFQSTPSAWRETAKLHRKAFFISPILVQSCKKGCKRLHSAPEKMIFFEKREKNSVRNLQHLSVRL